MRVDISKSLSEKYYTHSNKQQMNSILHLGYEIHIIRWTSYSVKMAINKDLNMKYLMDWDVWLKTDVYPSPA